MKTFGKILAIIVGSFVGTYLSIVAYWKIRRIKMQRHYIAVPPRQF